MHRGGFTKTAVSFFATSNCHHAKKEKKNRKIRKIPTSHMSSASPDTISLPLPVR